LDANDGDEVTRLSVFKSLSGVANGISVGDVIEFVEVWEGLVGKAPSARCPGLWGSVHGIPKSNINFTVLCFVPSEDSISSIPSLGFIGGWVGPSHVGVTVEAVVSFSGIEITCLCIDSVFLSWFVTNESSLGWIIDITKVGEWCLLGSKTPNSGWADTEIVEGKEVGVNTSRSLNDTDLEVGEGDELSVD